MGVKRVNHVRTNIQEILPYIYFTLSNDRTYIALLTLNMGHADLKLAWLLFLKSKTENATH